MRLLLATAVTAASFATASPAAATCMPVVDRYGVYVATCSPPGGPAYTMVCVGDVCVVQ